MQDIVFANYCLLRPVYETTIYSDMNAGNVVPCNALSMTPLWSYQWLLDRKGPDPKIMLSICPPGLSLLMSYDLCRRVLTYTNIIANLSMYTVRDSIKGFHAFMYWKSWNLVDNRI